MLDCFYINDARCKVGRRSDHTRAEIRSMAVDAAEDLVVREGYGGLTARKVAAQIGYTVGTLYLVFQNLDELVLEVNGRTLDLLHEQLQAVVAGRDSPVVALLALGHAYVRFATAESSRWRLIYQHQLPVDQLVPDWFRAKVMRAFGLVEAQLRRLASDRPEQEVHRAARALWSGVHGVCLLGLEGKLNVAGSDSLQDLVESLVVNYLRGYAGALDVRVQASRHRVAGGE